ncbi:hypothetical protein KKC97_13370 [bacterium]|nr:hypothetical protein [bacterium]
MSKILFIGKWKLIEVGDWTEDELEEFDPAIIEFKKNRSGHLSFLALNAEIDWDTDEPEDYGRIDFIWIGFDDGTEVFGRGWAVCDGEELNGEIIFFKGDRYRILAQAMKP